MKIINVITIKNNVIDEIKSFPIHFFNKESEVVAKAECCFLTKATELGYNEFDKEENYSLLDEGYYEKENDSEGECVCISWSNVEKL